MADPKRWPRLFASLSAAQLGKAADLERWRARLLEAWPDYSFEIGIAEGGHFGPAASVERELMRESVAKAGLPLCAAAEQVARHPDMKHLSECDAERAKAAAKL
jgi:hypothetical protein